MKFRFGGPIFAHLLYFIRAFISAMTIIQFMEIQKTFILIVPLNVTFVYANIYIYILQILWNGCTLAIGI